jgi:tripartite-type tricarboxylate transporter receptor subunit TctC
VFDPERSALLPGVPDTTELGYKFGSGAWSGFYGPQGLPEDVRALLGQAFRQAFDSPEFVKLCLETGMTPEFLGRSAFEEFASSQAQYFVAEMPRLLEVRR